jgi:copper chaperone CopZ
MKSVTLKIEGMHCDGCAQTIKALIGSEPGVHAADVSYKDGQARILYDPQTIAEDQLVKVIEKGGYRVPAPAS